MHKIRKSAINPSADAYVLPQAADLLIHDAPAKAQASEEDMLFDPQTPIDYAKLQAEAILADARREAEEMRENARETIAQELDDLRENAREEGYGQGYAQGIAGAMTEAKAQREAQAVEQAKAVQQFLERATEAREQLLEDSVEQLKDLAVAIAEKVIRISLKSSSDIIARMIQMATEKRRRREWVHIYIAGCDYKGMANIVPELTMSLGHLSDRVRIIPLADEESGTCIVEFPDEIIDASVSTQLSSIRDIMAGGPAGD